MCRGEGRNYAEEMIKIDIPIGIQEGMQLRLSGKGNAGRRGGASGDLIVLIEEKANNIFQRDGQNVSYNLHITYKDAVFGANMEVPTIDGKAKIKIPAGTQNGKILRLKGKGLPILNSGECGDHLIHINVGTDQDVNREEKTSQENIQKSEGLKTKTETYEKWFLDRVKKIFG